MTGRHIESFDWLRSIAISGVIVLHVAARDWYTTPVGSLDWQLMNVADSIVRFSVPVFFMMSGALFLDPDRDVTVRSIVTKSLPRILVPFAVWSTVFAAVTTFGPGGDAQWPNFAVRLITGHYHLWFLIALAGLYVVTPLMRVWARDLRLLQYFIGLAVLFATVLPFATQIPVAGPVAQTLLDTLQLQMVLGYAVYFALGYLLQQMLITRRIALVAAVVGVVGIVATVVGTSLLSLRGGEPDGTLYGYLTPNVLVVAVAVFCVVTYVVENHARPRAPRAIAVVAGASFGIYLVHPLFQSLLEWAGITGATGGAAIGVPAVSVVIFAVSLLASLLIRRIPRVGTWVS